MKFEMPTDPDKFWNDAKMLKIIRGLCPRPGSEITSIELSPNGGKASKLTLETRKRIDARLRELKA